MSNDPPTTPQPTLVRRLLTQVGIDQAVLFALSARIWQIVSGPITLILIATYLSPAQQGFYYTFASLIALQSFFELGFVIVITNVASHEWAKLTLTPTGQITGNAEALSRLVSLGRLVFKWYAIASIAFVLLVGMAGLLFMSQVDQTVLNWQTPWLALVLCTGMLLWTQPFSALLEGCNQVATVYKFRLIQTVGGSFVVWTTLLFGGNLWCTVTASLVIIGRDLGLLLIRYRTFFAPFWSVPTGPRMHWHSEIWPMQWRLAASGLVNYFALSLFSPIMFFYYGPTVAGRMGMTWTLTTMLQVVALAWVQTKVPHFGILIARKEYTELDDFFKRTLLVSISVIGLGALGGWLGVVLLNSYGFSLAERMLPPLPTGIFFLGVVLMQVSQCQSAYLRAHRQEPIMVMSVTTSLLTGLLVWLLGAQSGPLGAAVAYLATAVLVVIWETRIWQRCRIAWHT